MPIDRPTSPRKPHHLERLLEVSRTLSSTHDLPQLLQSVVDSAAELTQSEAASILLYDPSAGELRFEASSGAPPGALSAGGGTPRPRHARRGLPPPPPAGGP